MNAVVGGMLMWKAIHLLNRLCVNVNDPLKSFTCKNDATDVKYKAKAKSGEKMKETPVLFLHVQEFFFFFYIDPEVYQHQNPLWIE